MTFPICTVTQSPVSIFETSVRTSLPSTLSHTLLTFSDIFFAKSSTDFLRVHSSMISPKSRRNITEPAVLKSFLNIETPIAVASSTGTSIFPLSNVLTPLPIYFTDFTAVTTFLTDIGRNSLLAALKNTLLTSLS